MTFKTLKKDDQKISCHSSSRLSDYPLTSNLRIDTAPTVIKSLQETFTYEDTVFTNLPVIPEDGNCQAKSSVPAIDTYDLICRQRLRPKIVKISDSH